MFKTKKFYIVIKGNVYFVWLWNKQEIFPFTVLKDWFLKAFTARYAQSQIPQIGFVFKRLEPLPFRPILILHYNLCFFLSCLSPFSIPTKI